eukprot:TRINITY_DN16635_c0_g4_i1.p2 TRINITY_DN16635_c0_g4~~TRINITY_DN16635_c0_g4_i1.p2  ORF type:complete len:253 (+),score=55.60 TRINITY_DN16635_c0_g4_i1:144-902(+)
MMTASSVKVPVHVDTSPSRRAMFTLPATSTAAASNAGQKRNAATKTEDDHRRTVRAVAMPVDGVPQLPGGAIVRGVLKAFQEVRTLKCVIDCFELPAENRFCAAAQKATVDFMESAKAYARGQEEKKTLEIGQPHLHVWSNWVLMLQTIFTEAGEEAKAKVVKDYIEKGKVMGMMEIMHQVKYAYKARTGQKTRKRLEVLVSPGTESHAVYELLRQQLKKEDSVRLLPGKAPRGAQERELQKWLEDNEQSMN